MNFKLLCWFGERGIHKFRGMNSRRISFRFIYFFAGVAFSLSFSLSRSPPFYGRPSIARRLILRVRSLARAKKPIKRKEIKASLCMRGTSLRAFALPDRFNRAARGTASVSRSETIVDFKTDSHRQSELINPVSTICYPIWIIVIVILLVLSSIDILESRNFHVIN